MFDAEAAVVVKLLKRNLIAMSKISRPYYDEPAKFRELIENGLMERVEQVCRNPLFESFDRRML